MSILSLAKQKILIFDGAIGTYINELLLDNPRYRNPNDKYPDCNEYLVFSNPDLIYGIHLRYLEAGADIVETNSFGASAHTLENHGLANQTYEINRRAAELAKSAAQKFSTPEKPRFVAGSIGAGSLLPSLGQITFDKLKESYNPQVRGLIDGGIDCFSLETSQDVLQLKAVISTILELSKGDKKPILVHVTLNAHGNTLTGSDIASILAALEPLPIDAIGVNCSEGPEKLTEPVIYLSKNSSKLLSVMPNAGLPELHNGNIYYSLSPDTFASSMQKFALEQGLNFAGGCCGTTPKHISALAEALENIEPRKPRERIPKVSSLYTSQQIDVTPKPLIISECTNASGNRGFKELLINNDFDSMLRMAQEQEKGGAHMTDLSLAIPGRNENEDIIRFSEMLNIRCRLPVMLDCRNPDAIESALKRLAGRCVINSINLEDGGQNAKRILKLCREFGAAVVCLAIDEKGIALTADRKIEISKRLFALATENGLSESDLFFDMLTFTLGSGDASLRTSAKETLNAISEIKKLFPGSFTILGVSNVSHGLSEQARRALNSVFLANAVESGLDAAILRAEKIIPINRIPEDVISMCIDLIFDVRHRDYDPLQKLIQRFSAETTTPVITRKTRLSPEKALREAVLTGDSGNLKTILEKLLTKNSGIDILNNILLPVMQELGKLFDCGKTQLPFVLRSAEVVQSAIDNLKPHLGKTQSAKRGSMVLATVRGDIHDIGKNLVNLIFTANGFRVIDLGVRQPAENIIEAVRKTNADAIGLSGLLVESARAMKEYMTIFKNAGLRVPVICGGAVLNEEFVKKELAPAYGGNVYYAKDALDGLKTLQSVILCHPAICHSERSEESHSTICHPERSEGSKPIHQATICHSERLPADRHGSEESNKILPGSRILNNIPLPDLLNELNHTILFSARWKLLSSKPKPKQLKDAEQLLTKLLSEAKREKLFAPKVVYGFFSAVPTSKSLILSKPGSKKKLLELDFSSKQGRQFLKKLPKKDLVIALQLVTLGSRIARKCSALGKSKKIEKQFLFYGLAAELTESLAKWSSKNLQQEARWQRSHRISPGYPVLPISEQKKFSKLLDFKKVNVKLSSSYQLVPEFSTSALVFQ